MTITIATFRQDFSEFASQSAYPDSVITYWLAVGAIMLGINSGTPPTVCSFVGSIEDNILDITATNFGTISLLPLLLQGANIPNQVGILNQISGNPPGGLGTYLLSQEFAEPVAAEEMVAVSNTIGAGGSNPFWGPSSILATSPPTTIADIALENWVAHQIVLEKQALAAAATGGNPGTTIGVITSKSVNGVSVGYDVSAVIGDNGAGGGYYAQTIYGLRFWRLARARSAGPYQIGVGQAPPFLFFNSWGLYGSGNAWAGPYPGIQQGDSGFSS